MMPVVKGDDYTLRQIMVYSALLVGSTLFLALLNHSWIYWFVVILCNYYLIKKVLLANQTRNEKEYRHVFGYSIVYLFGIFGALMLDGLLNNMLK